MVHIQQAIFRCSFAPLAQMTVPGQYIFAHIPEPEHWPLLVRFPFYCWVAYFLEIKLRHLNRRTMNGQDAMNQPDCFQMAINFVLHRGRKPALRFGPVQESCLAIAGLPVRSEEHTSELQSHSDLVCRLLLEKKKITERS